MQKVDEQPKKFLKISHKLHQLTSKPKFQSFFTLQGSELSILKKQHVPTRLFSEHHSPVGSSWCRFLILYIHITI